jgi:hypothetical protein
MNQRGSDVPQREEKGVSLELFFEFTVVSSWSRSEAWARHCENEGSRRRSCGIMVPDTFFSSPVKPGGAPNIPTGIFGNK